MNGALTVIVAAVTCTAGLIGWVVISERLDRARTPVPVYAPRHAPGPAVTLPVADPDGEAYVAQLRTAGRLPYVTNGPYEADDSYQPDWLDEDELDAGWRAQTAPLPGVEILTAPDRIVQTGYLTATVLNRVREGLLGVEPDGMTATFTPAPGVTMPVSDDPDTTGVHPHAVGTWGKPADELADELAARYLT